MNGLDGLQPNDREGIGIFSFLLDLAHESWSQRGQEELDSGTIVVLIVCPTREVIQCCLFVGWVKV